MTAETSGHETRKKRTPTMIFMAGPSQPVPSARREQRYILILRPHARLVNIVDLGAMAGADPVGMPGSASPAFASSVACLNGTRVA